ncbi:MAG: DMT family transporter [bacterium]
MKSNKLWLVYAVTTTLAWGVWGALIDITAEAGFPETLGYCVWALTMLIPAFIALKKINWKIEYNLRSVVLGCAVGFLGAGGQLILFKTLRIAPAYLVFPFISLSPLMTIILAIIISKEKTKKIGWTGIILALIAGVLLSYSKGDSGFTIGIWVLFAFLVFAAWGIQGFIISYANETMKAESIFFYMMLTGILLIPVALIMTDFSQPINWGFRGPYLAALIQILNAFGALFLVYAFRYGKAMIVSPLTNAGAPVITIIISLIIYQTLPNTVNAIGMILAVIAAFLMSLAEESQDMEVQPSEGP